MEDTLGIQYRLVWKERDEDRLLAKEFDSQEALGRHVRELRDTRGYGVTFAEAQAREAGDQWPELSSDEVHLPETLDLDEAGYATGVCLGCGRDANDMRHLATN